MARRIKKNWKNNMKKLIFKDQEEYDDYLMNQEEDLWHIIIENTKECDDGTFELNNNL